MNRYRMKSALMRTMPLQYGQWTGINNQYYTVTGRGTHNGFVNAEESHCTAAPTGALAPNAKLFRIKKYAKNSERISICFYKLQGELLPLSAVRVR